jgi:excinuclease UvrABC helicase subunit UvrB
VASSLLIKRYSQKLVGVLNTVKSFSYAQFTASSMVPARVIAPNKKQLVPKRKRNFFINKEVKNKNTQVHRSTYELHQPLEFCKIYVADSILNKCEKSREN